MKVNMFNQLFENLKKVAEAIGISMSSTEQQMKDYYVKKPKYSQLDFGIHSEVRFWILSDGTIIRVWQLSHAETAADAGIDYDELLDAGAIRGYSIKAGEIGIEGLVQPSSAQKSACLMLSKKHLARTVYIDFPENHWDGPIKNFEYVLEYGAKSLAEAKSSTDYQLFEKLMAVDEEVAVATEIPSQKKLKDYYKGKSTKLTLSTWPSEREGHEYKFWLLQDGTVIPVTYSHERTVSDVDIPGGRNFMEIGVAACYIHDTLNELGIDASRKLTKQQIYQLRNLGIEYKVTSIVAEIGNKNWNSPVNSSKHLDYLLNYGPHIDEAKVDDKEKFDYFLKRTNKHISLVQAAAAKIAKVYPEEFGELIKQTTDHDASKFKDPEMTPYIAITWRHKLENEKGDYDPYNGKGYQKPGKLEKEDENKATLHHITTNSHHPEYHLENKSDANINAEDRDKSDECVDASKMPDLDVAEMIADWQAMSEELQTNTAREWFDKQKGVRWHFSEHQKELIDRLLKVFEESGVEVGKKESQIKEGDYRSLRGLKDQLGLIHANGKVLKINIDSSHSTAMDENPNFQKAIESWLIYDDAALSIRLNAPLTFQQIRAIQKIIDEQSLLKLQIEIYHNNEYKVMQPIPRNWSELVRKMDKKKGVSRESRSVLSSVKESKHSHKKCMSCSKVPEVEILWAEGRAHAWFCKKCLKKWVAEGDGWHEVDAAKKIQNGEAAKKWGDNTSPNIIGSMKFLK